MHLVQLGVRCSRLHFCDLDADIGSHPHGIGKIISHCLKKHVHSHCRRRAFLRFTRKASLSVKVGCRLLAGPSAANARACTSNMPPRNASAGDHIEHAQGQEKCTCFFFYGLHFFANSQPKKCKKAFGKLKNHAPTPIKKRIWESTFAEPTRSAGHLADLAK